MTVQGNDCKAEDWRESDHHTLYNAPEWIHVLCVVVFYCSITDYHTFSDLTNDWLLLIDDYLLLIITNIMTNLLYHSFHRSGVQAHVSRVLCSESLHVEVKVLAWAVIASETQHPLPSSFLEALGLRSLFSCRLSDHGHSQLLAIHHFLHVAFLITQHYAPSRPAGKTLALSNLSYQKGPCPFPRLTWSGQGHPGSPFCLLKVIWFGTLITSAKSFPLCNIR